MKKWLTTFFRFLIEIGKPRLLYFLDVMEKAKSGKVPTTAILHHSLMTASALSLLFFFTKTAIPVSKNASVATEMKQQSLGNTFQLKEILPLSWYTGNIQDIPRQELAFYTAAGEAGSIEVCSEQLLTENEQLQNLELDLFNPALGTLQEAEIVLEGTLMANADEGLATGTEYMLMLNSVLNYQLPGNAEDALAVSNKHTQRTYNEYVGQQGFQANGWQTTEVRKTFSTQLNLFQGIGKIQIPITAKDLVDFQEGQSHVTSTLKVKACIIYRY